MENLSHDEMFEKVKSKIIEACSELMELSFGCLVKPKNIEEYKFVDETTTGKIFRYTECGEQSECRVVWDDTRISTEKIKDLKILGHPITLEYVLKALEKIFPTNINSYLDISFGIRSNGELTGFQGAYEFYSTELKWNLLKPLSEQSPEVILFLYTILCKR